jgi:hypothetical protein
MNTGDELQRPRPSTSDGEQDVARPAWPTRMMGGAGSRANTERDLARYTSCLRRRWRTAVVVFAIVVGGTTAGMMARPPIYRATGLLEIKPESAGTVSVETLFGAERVGSDELETQFGILRSATLASRVVALVSRAPRRPRGLLRPPPATGLASGDCLRSRLTGSARV